MKEIILKEIDILRDEVKWWMNFVMLIISALTGGIFSFIQNKIIINFETIIIGISLFIMLFLVLFKIKNLKKEQNIMLKQLKRLKDKK